MPLELFSRALAVGPGAAVRVVDDAGSDLGELPIARYLGPADAEELELLQSLPTPVLDVGCGPGRHVSALVAHGIPALGIDVSAEAVALARSRGGRAMRRSVFGSIPRAGRWGSVLLLDGNIGIGGNPAALLGRVCELVRPGGMIVVEIERRAASAGPRHVRLEGVGLRSHLFPWGALDRRGIHAAVTELKLHIAAERVVSGRQLVVLEHR
jgi:SAM-dependent methyltransferase